MILSNECFVKENCKKNLRGDCPECDFCLKLFKLEKLYSNTLLPQNKWVKMGLRIDADGTDAEQFNNLKNIQDNIVDFVSSGKSLYIHSSICGNGKTAWAIRMIQSYLNSIWITSPLTCRALFVNIPHYFLSLKDSITKQNDYINHIKSNVLDADLVVWDELGVKCLTTYEHENLLDVINTRIENNKCNIYTSNLSSNELKERIGDRLYSRIISLSTDIEFHGMDKRGIVE